MSTTEKKEVFAMVPAATGYEPTNEVMELRVGTVLHSHMKVDHGMIQNAREDFANKTVPDGDFTPFTGHVHMHTAEHYDHRYPSYTTANDLNPITGEEPGFVVLVKDPDAPLETLTSRQLFDAIYNTKKETEYVMGMPAGRFIRNVLTEGGLSVPDLDDDMDETYFVLRSWCEKNPEWIQFLPYIVFFKRVEGRIKVFVYQRGKGVGEERLAMNHSIGVGGHINPQDRYDILNQSINFGHGDHPDAVLVDHGPWKAVMRNMVRETDEEVMFTDGHGKQQRLTDLPKFAGMNTMFLRAEGGSCKPLDTMVAFLDYSAGEVEKVHLGLFVGVEVPEDWDIVTREEELVDYGFMDLEELHGSLANGIYNPNSDTITPLECWSQSIVRSLFETQQFHEKHFAHTEEWNKHNIVDFGVLSENVARADRWKIGTLSAMIGLSYYDTNVIMKV